MIIEDLLKKSFDEGASDLLLSVGYPPLIRKFGELIKLSEDTLKVDFVRQAVGALLKDNQKKRLDRDLQIDFGYELKDVGRFRVNVFQERRGVGATFRTISNKINSIEELDLPSQLKELCRCRQGLILVTGPTGSGKSTTLSALVNQINSTLKKHIITLEDPIEFIYEGDLSVIHQRELGTHMLSFADGLKGALREDPDIILVGELRDYDTISLAMTAAETGHLIFGTLHTSSALKTINRIIDSFPENQQNQIKCQLSESLEAVIAQNLIRRVDKPGMVPIVEILINTPAVANLIREGKNFQISSVIQTGLRYGMQSYEQSKINLIKREIIAPKEEQTVLPVEK
ncbi:MAG: type IV pilus twitching motility protein PilT [bacterium]|nr:type IV pilus twitching motility protein PilT [bacterium]